MGKVLDISNRHPISLGLDDQTFVDPEAIVFGFRKAMRRLTSTVTLITTELGGVRFGMAATAVSSLCASPPAILACVSHTASIYQPLMERRQFCVNMLRSSQDGLVSVFGGKVKGEERFGYGTWDRHDDIPFLVDGQAALFCNIDGCLPYGGHEVIIGKIRSIRVSDQISPLLWQDGKTAVSRPSPMA